MTSEERGLILSLVVVPGRGRAGSPEDVLRHFGVTDGRALGLGLLRGAVERQDELDIELALIVCFTFGFTMDHLDLLVHLSSVDWHSKHEDVVTALGKLQTPDAVEALYQATRWIPEYLGFDETRALAMKAIRALGRLPGREAEQALERVLHSDSEMLQARARVELERRDAS
jgi:hypothetical protein